MSLVDRITEHLDVVLGTLTQTPANFPIPREPITLSHLHLHLPHRRMVVFVHD